MTEDFEKKWKEFQALSKQLEREISKYNREINKTDEYKALKNMLDLIEKHKVYAKKAIRALKQQCKPESLVLLKAMRDECYKQARALQELSWQEVEKSGGKGHGTKRTL